MLDILEKLVKSQVTIDERIEYELQLLSEAPFLVEAFLKAYQIIHIDRIAKPTNINEPDSMIAFHLGITTKEPAKMMHYPVSNDAFPDIDSDFADPKRAKEYLRAKYGEDFVIGIGNYGTFKARALITDLARLFVDENKKPIISHDEVKTFTKKLPFRIDNEIAGEVEDELTTENEIVFNNKDLQLFQAKYPRIFDHFALLYGKPKSRGMHAAGTCILPQPARETLPLMRSRKEEIRYVSEFVEGLGVQELTSIGIIKIDILGLKALRILDTANKLIMLRYGLDDETPSPCACKSQGKTCDTNFLLPFAIRKATGERYIDLDMLCQNIPLIYENIGNHLNQGVFQLEPSGISEFAHKFKPTEFMHLAYITALYRPGPLDAKLDELGQPIDTDDPKYANALSAAESFIERRHGRQQIFSPSKRVEEVLKNSYFIIVFQEDLTQTIMAMTNWTFNDAEKLRKFLTKVKPGAKGPDELRALEEYKQKYIKACLLNGCEQKEADGIWSLIEPFARYGFVKSHAVAYSLISYETAFMRAFFPLEFLTALLIHSGDEDKTVEYIRAIQNLGYTIKKPDINLSENDFAISENNEIMCGLLSLKGIGEAGANEIVNNRNQYGKFVSLEDFLSRTINWRKLNIGDIEVLIRAGTFDAIDSNRAFLWAKTQINKGKKKLADFNVVNNELIVEDWSDEEKTLSEKKLMGYSLDDFLIKNKKKLQEYKKVIKQIANQKKKDTSLGTVDSYKLAKQKDGNTYCRASVSNVDGVKETWLLFAQIWNSYKEMFKESKTYCAIGKRDENVFIVNAIKPMEDVIDNLAIC